MYRVQPRGINIKDNERNVPDGFLQESINLQWKDGSYRPIPERLASGITRSDSGISNYILHKVSDEDKINVLAFDAGYISWFGVIENGVYTEFNESIGINGVPQVNDFDSFSFTILNGLLYFMSSSQEFYYKIQYNEVNDEYEVKDMYAWKDLIPFFPTTGSVNGTMLNTNTNTLLSQCGIILIRFTLVLNTGEEVLHSPIYTYYMYAINESDAAIQKDAVLTNIHTLVNTNLVFNDIDLFNDEMSAINVYASIPYHITTVGEETTTATEYQKPFSRNDARGEVQRLADEPFYLIKTIEKPSSSVNEGTILLFVGEIDAKLTYYTPGSPSVDVNTSKINTDTIAAGSVMPVDNFTYHRAFGKITSNNGRLLISEPKTVLSNGHIRALALTNGDSRVGYYINTEDGDLKAVGYLLEGANLNETIGTTSARGLLSYPDSRATNVGGNEFSNSDIPMHKLRANKSHNIACAFNFIEVSNPAMTISTIPGFNTIIWTVETSATIVYGEADTEVAVDKTLQPLSYTSENRLQFSEIGEFSVWPALNSYRVGEGKIIFTGSNSIDPANSDYISPLFIGTSDGIYTANFDPTGANLIQSITKAAELPALSDKRLLIDQNLIYVSDKGLIVINNGKVVNITERFFPEYGDGGFPDNNTVFPNYNTLTQNLSGSDYKIADIVDYMKEALFAYDGRRNNVWCSNPNEEFSLVYNLDTMQWTMSTYVFESVVDFGGILNTTEGEVYSRYLVRKGDSLDILSGEDLTEPIYIHLLTRGIKVQSPDQFKKIQRLIARCELYRNEPTSYLAGYFTFGVWGKQDINKNKENIPLAAYRDNTRNGWPNNVRQDIPMGRMKGKYKIITILQGGYISPSSSIDGYEIEAIPVENNILR